MGNNDVKDDGDGCYIVEAENAADKFYNTKTEGEVTSYTFASYIRKSASNTNQAGEAKIPFTGAYMIDNYDKANKTCTLVRNDQYKGNFEGQKGGFDKIVYIQIVSETQLTQLEQGQVNVVAGITGGTDTDAALKLVRENPIVLLLSTMLVRVTANSDSVPTLVLLCSKKSDKQSHIQSIVLHLQNNLTAVTAVSSTVRTTPVHGCTKKP